VTDPTRPLIEHSRFCQRRRPPVLIAGWDGHALLSCPDCGRRAPADDTRETTPEGNPR